MRNTTQALIPYSPVPVSLPVFEYEGKLVADSRDVAPFAGKDHAHLLRDIRRYVKVIDKSLNPNLVSVDFFIPETYTDPTGRKLPCFYCTEKGCAMVANKTPGERGIIFTALFVKAFYDMRTLLLSPGYSRELDEEEPEIHSPASWTGKPNVLEKAAYARQVEKEAERHRARLRDLACQLAEESRR